MSKRRRKKSRANPKSAPRDASPVSAAPPAATSSVRSGRLVTVAIVGLGLAACAAVAYFLFAARPGFERRPLNVVLVTVDTLRADRIGAYGGSGVPTPNLDRLAESGVLFEQAFTSAPITLPSHASIFTGQYPIEHGVRDNGGAPLDSARTTLAEVLSGAGYRTGAFIGAFVLDARWGLDQGFDHYSDALATGASGNLGGSEAQRRGDVVLEEALEWMGSVEDGRFFSWIHLFDPHTPYDPPEPFRSRLDDPYDGEVAFVDSLVGRLLDWLERENLGNETLVLVAADHGESLGEHGEPTHGFFVYDATMRVPLILRAPYAGLAGRRVTELVRTIDIMPTVLDLVGLEAPSETAGRSLLPVARGLASAADTAAETAVAYGEATFPSHYGWSELRSLRDDDFLYVDAPRPELYELASDPDQSRNLASSRRDRLEAYEAKLEALEAAHESSAAIGASARRSTLDPEVAARLAALGYAGAGAAGRDPDRAPPDPKDKIQLFNRIREAAALADVARLDEAATLLESVLREDPEILEARNMLGGYRARMGELDAAVAAYRAALEKAPDYAPAVFGLASAYLEMGRREEARLGLERMLELEPGNAAASLMLGRLLMDEGRFDDALARLEAASPASREDASRITTLTAEARIGLGELDAASEALEAALEKDPELPSAHYQLAVIREKRGDLQGAREAYERELEIAPDDYRAHFDLAKLLGQSGRAEEMIEHLERSIASNPDFPLSHLYLANALLDRGELERAVSLAERGIALGPEPAFAPLGHFILADAYQRLGRGADAARQMAIAQRLHENAPR